MHLDIKDEVIYELRNFHNQNVHNLNSSPNVVWAFK
jgi:hypothetical protein